MYSSSETDQFVGYEMHPFEMRLAELEVAGGAPAERLAFYGHFAGARTHQFYFDRFQRLRGKGPGGSLMEEAESTPDGHRGAAHNYLTHGLHSYKGKYFPQVVRSLLNHAGLSVGGAVVDPFVGSGTTTLETALMGLRGHGIDRNPLAVLIAKTKHAALLVDASPSEVAGEILSALPGGSETPLPNADYLARWFPSATLDLIQQILGCVGEADVPSAFQDVARLTLSTLLRGWSLQEPSQLRVHRRESAPPAEALRDRFAADLYANLAAVARGRQLLGELGIAVHAIEIAEGDARTDSPWGTAKFDALVTSPPYATALPYIDTDRLSIYALGLDDVADRFDLEWSMIGNREIRRRQRIELEECLRANEAGLPEEVIRDIETIKRRNDRAGVGFRRQNLPALLYRYFDDMKQVFREAHSSLRQGALCAVVVGDSHTTAGTKRFRIRTADFLCLTAESCGFETEERIAMGGQTAYLPHQRNGIPDEEILLLKAA